MARVKITKLVDDIDGVSEATETVKFSFQGEDYEIHLNAKHTSEFRAIMAEWIPGSRRSRKTTRAPRNPDVPGTDRAENARIRAWAAKQGFDLPPRGRIKIDVRNAYFDAHM
jgi:Lsr2